MEKSAVPQASSRGPDLHIDSIYKGGRNGNAGDDPLPKLLSVSNQGGFRYRGNLKDLRLVVLVTSFNDPDWPDRLDRETGVFTYYGDNRTPRAMSNTPRKGNEILERLFQYSALEGVDRSKIPPIFVFQTTGVYRDVRFLGLAVAGVEGLSSPESLLAIWRTSKGRRFQNYRANFTILDTEQISRDWIDDLVSNRPSSIHAPSTWRDWVYESVIRPLRAPRTVAYRSKEEQLTSNPQDTKIIIVVYNYFKERPHQFEEFAAHLARLTLPSITEVDVTRPSRDGGRDAVGKYRIGDGPGSIQVDFSLEAKCYGLNSSVGVKEMSRLISRLRHRQFGILVTTSFVGQQVYKEIRDDEHPIVVISAIDIVNILKRHVSGEVNDIKLWLSARFAQAVPEGWGAGQVKVQIPAMLDEPE